MIKNYAIRQQIVPLLITGSLLMMGLVGVARSITLWSAWNTLQQDGIAAEGTIIALNDNQPFGSNYRATYEYQREGVLTTQEERVPRRTYRRMEVGQTLDVLYMPDNPLTSIADNDSGLILFTVTTGLWVAGSLGLMVFYIILIGKLSRLQDELPELDLSALNLPLDNTE